MALGLLEQLDAHDGRPVVAVTDDLVKVAQKADAVAPLALMYEAHGSVSGLVQAHTAAGEAAAAARKHRKPRILTDAMLVVVVRMLGSRGR